MADIVCSDPRHALRSAEPGWRAVLGTTTGAGDGYLCPACVRGRDLEATVDTAHTANAMIIRQGGGVGLTAMRRYFDGTIVGTVEKRGDLADCPTLTPAQKTNLRNMLDAVRDWLLS